MLSVCFFGTAKTHDLKKPHRLFFLGLIPSGMLMTPKCLQRHRLTPALLQRLHWITTIERQEGCHLLGDVGAGSVASIWLLSFCSFLSSLFMVGKTFALIPWNMDALWKEKRDNRPFTATWEWIKKELNKGCFKYWVKREIVPSPRFFCVVFFFFSIRICHLNSNHCTVLRGNMSEECETVKLWKRWRKQ